MEFWTEPQMVSIHKMLNPRSIAIVGATPRMQYGGRFLAAALNAKDRVERGAFTGACTQTRGRFQIADGGTLFLDEIGDMPLELQPKLLRALQEREFERLGSNQTVRVNAASNRWRRIRIGGRWFVNGGSALTSITG